MPQSHTATNNPLRYFTNYKFTGKTEDITEYSINNSSSNTNLIQDESIYMIDGKFIEYIGEENFEDWKNAKRNNNIKWTIVDFLNEFNIDNNTFFLIINENPRLLDFYDVNEIINIRNR